MIVPFFTNPCAPTTDASPRKRRAPQRFDRQRSTNGKSTRSNEMAHAELGDAYPKGAHTHHKNHRHAPADDRSDNLAVLSPACHHFIGMWQRVYAARHWRWVRRVFGPEQNDEQYWTRRALVDGLVRADLDARQHAALTVEQIDARGPAFDDKLDALAVRLADVVRLAGGVPRG